MTIFNCHTLKKMHCLVFLTESEEDNKNAVCLKFDCLYFLLFFYLIIIWAENIFNFEKRVLFGKSCIYLHENWISSFTFYSCTILIWKLQSFLFSLGLSDQALCYVLYYGEAGQPEAQYPRRWQPHVTGGRGLLQVLRTHVLTVSW